MATLKKRATKYQRLTKANDPKLVAAVNSIVDDTEKWVAESYHHVLSGETKSYAGDRTKKNRGRTKSLIKCGNMLPVFDVLQRIRKNSDLLFSNTNSESTIMLFLSGEATHILSRLADLARNGDENAIKNLWLIANEAVIQLNAVADCQTPLAKSFAETLPRWPAFVSPHGDNLKDRNEIIKKLGIGKRCALDVSKRWSNKSAAAQQFRHLFGTYIDRAVSIIDSARRLMRLRSLKRPRRLRATVNAAISRLPSWLGEAETLPKMSSKKSVEKWRDVTLKLLREAGGGKLSGLPDIESAGEHRAGVRRRQEESLRQQQGQAEQAIKERFEKAFMAR